MLMREFCELGRSLGSKIDYYLPTIIPFLTRTTCLSVLSDGAAKLSCFCIFRSFSHPWTESGLVLSRFCIVLKNFAAISSR